MHLNFCPRTIDKPLLIFGLEMEDIGVLVSTCGIAAVLVNPVVPLIIFLCSWPGLVIIKRGKPEGYVLHLLYSLGAEFKGLLPSGDKIRYSPFTKQK